MTDSEGAKTMLIGVQCTLLALFVPGWLPDAFPVVVAAFGTALVAGGYGLP
ncbi:hypothetical protein [Halobacterium litoreum]|uniref:Uncharacterized protein n=1 Tax=Halobacterium litoreum TaxID=2039234 RepID=A0ABD5NFS8_9EURY|nr:hypothetical protein [Halobacterium litoreum]UHH13148.1 hypothetical protein LT972_13450 [Halobacterium litoreum]